MSTGLTLGLSAGAFVVGGLISAASTHVDGTREVHSRYSNDYQLQPTSQEAAKKSIEFQRMMGGFSIVGGGVLAGIGALGMIGGVRPELSIMGSALVGAGLAKLVRLSGAEEKIDRSLPETTTVGEPEMRRRNIMAFASDGAGYSASGVYSGAWSGGDVIADGVTLAPGMQPLVSSTLDNPALAGTTGALRGFVLPDSHGGAVPVANAPAPDWSSWAAASAAASGPMMTSPVTTPQAQW